MKKYILVSLLCMVFVSGCSSKEKEVVVTPSGLPMDSEVVSEDSVNTQNNSQSNLNTGVQSNIEFQVTPSETLSQSSIVPTVSFGETAEFSYENVDYELTINETEYSYTDFVNFLPAITNEPSAYKLTEPKHFFFNDDAKVILSKLLDKYEPTCTLISYEGDSQASEMYLYRTECRYIVLTHSVKRDYAENKDFVLEISYTKDTFVRIPDESYMRELYSNIKAANSEALADVDYSLLPKIMRMKPEVYDSSLAIIQAEGREVILAYSDKSAWNKTMLGFNGSTLFSRENGEKIGEVDGFYLQNELNTRFGIEVKGQDTLISEGDSTILIRRFDLNTTVRFYLVVRYLTTDEGLVREWAEDLVLGYRQ